MNTEGNTMRIEFAKLIQFCVLLFVGTVAAGCVSGTESTGKGSTTKHTHYYYARTHQNPLVVDFERGWVGQDCRRITEISTLGAGDDLSKYEGNDEWVKLGGKGTVYKGPFGITKDHSFDALIQGGYKKGGCYSSIPEDSLDFSFLELDVNQVSVTASSPDQGKLEKYTILVVAEKGLHAGYSYGRFENTGQRNRTTGNSTSSTTTANVFGVNSGINITDPGEFSGIHNYSIGALPGKTVSTVIDGVTKLTTTYRRTHTIRYFKDKVEKSFNLGIISNSIKGNDEWKVVGI